jgi:hypothetical protein
VNLRVSEAGQVRLGDPVVVLGEPALARPGGAVPGVAQ